MAGRFALGTASVVAAECTADSSCRPAAAATECSFAVGNILTVAAADTGQNIAANSIGHSVDFRSSDSRNSGTALPGSEPRSGSYFGSGSARYSGSSGTRSGG